MLRKPTVATSVVHDGGLWEAGGTTGVDQGRGILHGHMLAHLARKTLDTTVLPIHVAKVSWELNGLADIFRKMTVDLTKNMFLGCCGKEAISKVLDLFKAPLNR